MARTHGYLIDDSSAPGGGVDIFSETSQGAKWDGLWCWTKSLSLAFAETFQIDLTGVEVTREVLFPQGWTIQESRALTCFLSATSQYNAGTAGPGLPPMVEIIDFYSTKETQPEDFAEIVAGLATPGSLVTANASGINIGSLNAPSFLETWDGWGDQKPYWDTEQVIAGTYRRFGINVSAFDDKYEQINAAVRKVPMILNARTDFGSMEPIATDMLHYTRVVILVPPLTSSGTGGSEQAWTMGLGAFYNIPPANIPMVCVRDDPGFIQRMTMERRSKDV
jgi:hypothetical protein